jgi:hypothetical protein
MMGHIPVAGAGAAVLRLCRPKPESMTSSHSQERPRSFMTSRPNLAMPPREYTPITTMIALHPTGSAADVSSKMGRGVIDA